MLTRLLLIYPLPQAASPPPKHRSSRHPGTVVCRAGGGHSPPGRGRGPHTAVGIGITRGLVRTHPHRAPLRGSGEVPELMCALGEVGTGKEHVLEKHWPSRNRLCCPRSESECPVPSTGPDPALTARCLRRWGRKGLARLHLPGAPSWASPPETPVKPAQTLPPHTRLCNAPSEISLECHIFLSKKHPDTFNSSLSFCVIFGEAQLFEP